MKRTLKGLLLSILSFTSSFSKNDNPRRKADTIFYGGDIITVNDGQPQAEAVAVSKGKIIFVGSKDDAMRMKGAETKMVDLQGKTMLPGFFNSHTHIFPEGLILHAIDVSPFKFTTRDEILKILKDNLEKGPVLAFGYDPSLMEGKTDLNFEILDALSEDVPILVINKSAHIVYGNHAAFASAKVTESTKNPPGGSYDRDANNKLTGVAYEVPTVSHLLGGFPGKEKVDFAKVAKDAGYWYAQNGYTSVADLALGLPLPTELESIEILRQVANEPDAAMRIHGYVVYPLIDAVPALMKKNNKNFQVKGIKIWSDGSIQGHTAAFKEKYDDVDSCGILNYSQTELYGMVKKAHEQDLQIAIHANGDKAIADTLNAYENALKAKPSEDPRFRLEHTTIASQEDFKRLADLKVTPTFTPVHIYYWGKVFRDKIIGEERANRIDSGRAAKQHGLKYSYNDDILGEMNPLFFIQTAVTREMKDGEVLNEAQKITVDDAIKSMTIYPAWQVFREKELGTIEKGKFADFVILEKNPKKVPVDTISSIKILGTWKDGREVSRK